MMSRHRWADQMLLKPEGEVSGTQRDCPGPSATVAGRRRGSRQRWATAADWAGAGRGDREGGAAVRTTGAGVNRAVLGWLNAGPW